ncbi:hypothetical protein [Synechococcus sp. UW105]|uniref:hypothetical protein n=1 Tax=Synechococcus sp. UW105 TaxID=337067 RepID=UPI000E0E5F4E|nr:hypothetical protein [Synechococcus sp. UW105]
MTNLFNERALKNRHRAGDRNGPVTLLTPPLRATLGLGSLIAICGALWATFARIPVSVKGTGILLPVSTINSSLSATDGEAFYMFNKLNEPWHDEARRFMHSPDIFSDQEMAELANDVFQASQFVLSSARDFSKMTSSNRFTQNLQQTFKGLPVKKGRLLIWVRSSAELEQLSSEIDQLNRLLRKTDQQTQNINAKQNILREELASQSAYLSGMQSLAQKGYVSTQEILQNQSKVDNIKSNLHTLDTELIKVESERDQAYRKLRNELAMVIDRQLIFSPRNVYLSSVIPNNGETVNKGKILLKLSDDILDQPQMVPVFLSSKQMAQVFPGMSALATPSGYKRAEVGGIKGEVISMAKLPSGLDEVSARIGVKALAETIVSRHPSPALAILALERSEANVSKNSGGYVWTSNSSLPFPPTPGDRIDVEITTRRVAPIALVLPAIRSFFGMAPPDVPEASPPNGETRIKGNMP